MFLIIISHCKPIGMIGKWMTCLVRQYGKKGGHAVTAAGITGYFYFGRHATFFYTLLREIIAPPALMTAGPPNAGGNELNAEW